MVNRTGRGYFKKGHKTNVGRKRKEITKKRISDALKGHPNWNPDYIGCFKKGGIPWNKEKPNLKIKGKNHFNYGKPLPPEVRKKISQTKRKGKCTLLHLLQKSAEYNEWKESVLERDNYTCKKCGKKKQLHVHHIISPKKHLELILYKENGLTLCASCHKKLHNKEMKKNGKLSNKKRRIIYRGAQSSESLGKLERALLVRC